MNKQREASPIYSKPVSDMTEAERLTAINELEAIRNDIISQVEGIMLEVARETKNSRYKRRKYKLGKSPNDISES